MATRYGRAGPGYSYCPTCLAVERKLHFLSDALINLTVDLGIFPKGACKLSLCEMCVSFLKKTSDFRKTALEVQQIMANLQMGMSPAQLLKQKKYGSDRKFLMDTKGQISLFRSSLPSTATLRLLPTPHLPTPHPSSSRSPSLSSPKPLSPSSSPEPPSSPETTYTRPFPSFPSLPALNFKVSQNDVPKLTETQKPVYIFVKKSKHPDNTDTANLLKSGPSKTANLKTNKNETATSNTNETKLSVTRSNNGKLKLEKEKKTVTFLRHDDDNVNSRVNANVTMKNNSNETILISDSETDNFDVSGSDKSEYISEFEPGSNVLNLVSDENSCGTPEYLSEYENDEVFCFGNEVSNNFGPPKTTESRNQDVEQHNIVVTGNVFEGEVNKMIDSVDSDNNIEQEVRQCNAKDDIKLKNVNVSTSIDKNTNQSNDVRLSRSRKTITISARKLRSHNRIAKEKKAIGMVRLSDEILSKKDDVCAVNQIEKQLIVRIKPITIPTNSSNIDIKNYFDKNTDSKGLHLVKHSKINSSSKRTLRRRENPNNPKTTCDQEIEEKLDINNKINISETHNNRDLNCITDNANINEDSLKILQGFQDETTDLQSHVENNTHKNEIITKDKCETKDKSGSDTATSNILLLDENGGKVIKKNTFETESNSIITVNNDYNNKEALGIDTNETEDDSKVESEILKVLNPIDYYKNENIAKQSTETENKSNLNNGTTNVLNQTEFISDNYPKEIAETEDKSCLEIQTLSILNRNRYKNETIETEVKCNTKSETSNDLNKNKHNTENLVKYLTQIHDNDIEIDTINVVNKCNNEVIAKETIDPENDHCNSRTLNIRPQNEYNNEIIANKINETKNIVSGDNGNSDIFNNDWTNETIPEHTTKTENKINIKSNGLSDPNQFHYNDETVTKETITADRNSNTTSNILRRSENSNDFEIEENNSIDSDTVEVLPQNNEIIAWNIIESEDKINIKSRNIKGWNENEHDTETNTKKMSETQYNNKTDNRTLNKSQQNDEANKQRDYETEDISVENGSFKASQQNDDDDNDIMSKTTPEAEDKVMKSGIFKILQKNEHNSEIVLKEINETQNNSSSVNETLKILEQSKVAVETIAKEMNETQYNNRTDNKQINKLQQNAEANRQDVHETEDISVERGSCEVSQQNDVNNDIISNTTPEAKGKLTIESDIFKDLRKNENSTEIVLKNINETQNNSSSENETLKILQQNIEGDDTIKTSIHEIEQNNRARNEILKDLHEYNNIGIVKETTDTKINGSTNIVVLKNLQLKENGNETIRTETCEAKDKSRIENDAVKILQENGKGIELITKHLCEFKNFESETLNLLKANEDKRDAITSHQRQVQDKIATEQIGPEIVFLKKPEQRIENEQVEGNKNEERKSLIQVKRNIFQDNLQNHKRYNDSILHDVQAQKEYPKKFRTNSDSNINSLNFEVARIEVPQKTEAEISCNDLNKINTKTQLVVNKVTSDRNWTESGKLSTYRKILPRPPYFVIPMNVTPLPVNGTPLTVNVTPITNNKRRLNRPSTTELQSLISVCLDHDYTSLNAVFDKKSSCGKLRRDILLKALEESTKRAYLKKKKGASNLKRKKSLLRQRQSIQVVSSTRLEENVNENEIKDINMSVSINLSDFFSDVPAHNESTTNVELEGNAEESVSYSDYTNQYAPVHNLNNQSTTNVELEYNAEESVRSSDYTNQCVMEQEEIHFKLEPIDYDSERTNSAQSDYNYENDVDTNRVDVNNITQNSLYDELLPINENLPIGIEHIKKENSNDGYIHTLQSNLIEPESFDEVNHNPPDTFEKGINQDISSIKRDRFTKFKNTHDDFVDRLRSTENSLLEPIYFANYVEECKDKINTSKSKNINNCDSFSMKFSTKRKRNSSEDIYNFETSDERYSVNSSSLISRRKKYKSNRNLLKKNIKEEIITSSSLIESEKNVNADNNELRNKDNEDSKEKTQRSINENKPSQSLGFEENDDLNEPTIEQNIKETELNKIALTDFIENYDEVTLNELSDEEDDEVLSKLVTNKKSQANLNPKHIVTNAYEKQVFSKTTYKLKKGNICKNPTKVTQESQLKCSLRLNKLLLKPIVVLEKIDPSTKTNFNSTENMKNDIIGYNIKNNTKHTRNRKSEATCSKTRQRSSRSMGNRIKRKRKRRNKESIRTRKHNMKSARYDRIAPIDFIKNNKIITLDELGEEFSNISLEEKEDIVSNTDNVKIHFQDFVHETPGKESNKEFNDYFGEIKHETNLYIERNINRAELLLVRENAMHDEFFVNAKYNCSQCVRVFEKGNQKYVHMRRHYPPRKAQELLRCGICDMWYSNNKMIIKHYGTHKRCLQCRWCERKFLFPNAVTNHIMREHPEMYIRHTDNSIDCDKRYPQRSLFQPNIYQIDTKPNTDKNNLSPEKFSSSLTITLPSETDPFSFLNNSPVNNSAINNSPIYDSLINNSAENLSNNTIVVNTENIKSENNLFSDNDSNTENDWSCFTQNNTALDKKEKDVAIFEEDGIVNEGHGLISSENSTSPGNLDATNQNINATFICFVCNEQFETYETLLEHQSLKYNFIKLRQRRNKTGFQCVLCSNSYHTFYNLFLHQISHKDYISKVPETKTTPANDSRSSRRKKSPYSCFICRNRFVSFNLLLTHQNESHYEYRNVINCSFDTLSVSEENLPKSESCDLNKPCQTSNVNNQPTTGIDHNLTDNLPMKDIVLENQSTMTDGQTPTGNNSSTEQNLATMDQDIATIEQDVETTVNDTSVENKQTVKDNQFQNRNSAAETKEVGFSSEDNRVSPKNNSAKKEYLCFLCDKRYASFYTLLSHQKFRHIFSQIL